MEKTFKNIRESNPNAVILYMGLYNPFKQSPNGDSFDSIIQKWNESARTLGLKYKVQVVDTFNLVTDAKRDLSSDVFHPNDATYQQIAESMSLVIEKVSYNKKKVNPLQIHLFHYLHASLTFSQSVL